MTRSELEDDEPLSIHACAQFTRRVPKKTFYLTLFSNKNPVWDIPSANESGKYLSLFKEGVIKGKGAFL